MSECLLDSNIIIELLRANMTVVPKFRQIIAAGWLVYYSPICVAEIYAGLRASEEVETAQFFSALICVPLDEEAGRLGGKIMHQYSKSYRLELADALIAATCITHQIPIWTMNRKHFPSPELVFFEDLKS